MRTKFTNNLYKPHFLFITPLEVDMFWLIHSSALISCIIQEKNKNIFLWRNKKDKDFSFFFRLYNLQRLKKWLIIIKNTKKRFELSKLFLVRYQIFSKLLTITLGIYIFFLYIATIFYMNNHKIQHTLTDTNSYRKQYKGQQNLEKKPTDSCLFLPRDPLPQTMKLHYVLPWDESLSSYFKSL